MRNEWISTQHAIPSNDCLCWINTKKWGVRIATFYWEDAFKRKNMFIKGDGGHISISEVTHYQPVDVPAPPKFELI